ncbi:IS630-like element ISAzs37 family transposase [Azospirillum sp. B510]|uniref:IS630-like element ISAzs37 family transposase n=1 Tax=Azospirillum sp. (strain B510) TaxID=137722 RepID=UPI0009734CDC|nr:IS630-like element ISAzs37 family transposase [Azospirillum sp. B510]
MAGPYSQDLRDRVAAAVSSGCSARAAAARFSISVSTAIRWAKRLGAEGHAQARPMGGDHRSRLSDHREAVLTLVAHQPDLTLEEIRAELNARHGVSVSLGTVWRFLKAQNLTLKKTLHAAEQQRDDVVEARRAFIRRQPALDPERLVFLDETWASTNMTRRHGRCARGLRLLAPVPHGHWKTTTLIAGLRTTGIVAPYVLDGPINATVFRAYVEQVLAPTLQSGDILILDNLSSHKVAGVREAVEARGARVLYLPPYSPDLNPIEQAFAKLKALLRKAAERSRDGLWNAIGRIIDIYKPNECRNLFKNAGYPT